MSWTSVLFVKSWIVRVLNKINDSAISALLDTDRKFAALSKQAGAAEAFRQFVSPEAQLLTTQTENVEGVENIFDHLGKMPAGSALIWEPEAAGVAASGELGWTWGRYTYHEVNNSELEEVSRGKYLNVWVKIGENWKVFLDIGNATID